MSGWWKVCVLSLVFLLYLPMFLLGFNLEESTTLSQMLFPQKKDNTETLQTIRIFCTGRLQRRTAAVICIHIQVTNSPSDADTGRSKALDICFHAFSTLHLLGWLWEHLWHVWGSTVHSGQSSSCLLSFLSLDLYSNCLLSPPSSSAYRFVFFSTCSSEFALHVSLFVTHFVSLCLFVVFFLWTFSSSFCWFKRLLWWLCAQPHSYKIHKSQSCRLKPLAF